MESLCESAVFAPEFCFEFVTGSSVVLPVSARQLNGVWKTGFDSEGGYLFIAFESCDGGTCGRITFALDKAGTPQPSYKHIGRKIIWNIASRGTDTFDAVVWAPDTDEDIIKLSLSLSKWMLEGSGSVLGEFVCCSKLRPRQH